MKDLPTRLTNAEIAGILLAQAARHDTHAQRCRDTAKYLGAETPMPKRKRPASVDASEGALHGRILDILREASGPMRPVAIVAAANAPGVHVRLALRELEADGKIVSAGATFSKTYTLLAHKAKRVGE